MLDFAAYRKLVADWQAKATDDAVTVINWVRDSLQTDLGRIASVVNSRYARGRIDALNMSQLPFHVAGELNNILTPLIDRVLAATYESREIRFDPPIVFRREDAVKVINGIVKTGQIPRGAKPNQDVSAAQNFGYGLKIMARGPEKRLDVAHNPYVQDIWAFVDEKLGDDGQTMKVDVLYKNFMGIANSWNGKNYGLSRRMIQLYLLCLVRDGKVRVGVGPRSGLALTTLDYSNLETVDFSARGLDALTEVQKVAKPENWEVLRPYAEKLLDRTIDPSHDDAAIARCRADLRELFAQQKDVAARVVSRAASLFERLKVPNPYAEELRQIAALFATDVAGASDIDLILHGLKQALGYPAYDTGAVSQTEVDDLALRLKNYRDVQVFLNYSSDFETACAYRDHPLPEASDLREVIRIRQDVVARLSQPRPFIDSEVKLKTEMIGHQPPELGETGTIGALVHEYTTTYVTFHDTAFGLLGDERGKIRDLLRGDDLKALRILERIPALQPAITPSLEAELTELLNGISACTASSRTSLEAQLRRGPVHECGLTFANAEGWLDAAAGRARQAREAVDDAFDRKLAVFLNPVVRERLEQGKTEAVVAGLLQCSTPAELRSFLVKACLADDTIVETINRYLKRIVVRRVKLADFRPSLSTIEKEQLGALADEFRTFLEAELNGVGGDADVLPMLQLE